jgi:hypothetical protein
MTPTNNTSQQNQASLSKSTIIGAAIGLAVISFFLFSADEPDPAWGKFWMIRPLIIVPLAGATGGLCHYFISLFQDQIGMNKTVAMILSAIIFAVGLWMGVVLGLDTTMWN